MSDTPKIHSISGGGPDGVDPAVVAVLTAAIEASQPRVQVAAPQAEGPPAWRFSGRWWRTPISARRDRPQTRF